MGIHARNELHEEGMYGKKRDDKQESKRQKANQKKYRKDAVTDVSNISFSMPPNEKETRKYVSTPPKPRQWDAFISS